MPRYSRDFGDRYPESGDPRDFGRGEYRRGASRPAPSGGRWRESYPEGPGWGGSGWDRSGGQGFGGRRGELAMPRRDWETGQPWGGVGDADEVLVGDIMTENPEAVTPDTTLADAAARMRDLDVGILPVVDDLDSARLRGVVTDRDIAVRAVAEGWDVRRSRVAECMSSGVETVRETDHVREVLTVMKRSRVRRVPIVDRAGRLVGIVAQADLAVSYAGLDLQRETEVEEAIERISEPARPAWGRSARRWDAGRGRGGPLYDDWDRGGERDLGGRLREGWNTLRREARHLLGRGYDRHWY